MSVMGMKMGHRRVLSVQRASVRHGDLWIFAGEIELMRVSNSFLRWRGKLFLVLKTVNSVVLLVVCSAEVVVVQVNERVHKPLTSLNHSRHHIIHSHRLVENWDTSAVLYRRIMRKTGKNYLFPTPTTTTIRLSHPIDTMLMRNNLQQQIIIHIGKLGFW
jgi:hypothetical protein